MSNKKQSSIEWYENRLIQLDIDFGGHKNYWIERKKVREQAKAMHKEEIMKVVMDFGWSKEKAEKYYNETFGGDNE